MDIIWLRDESIIDSNNIPEPEDLVAEVSTNLEAALDAINELVLKLQSEGRENSNVGG